LHYCTPHFFIKKHYIQFSYHFEGRETRKKKRERKKKLCKKKENAGKNLQIEENLSITE